jgi:hypothetical protein
LVPYSSAQLTLRRRRERGNTSGCALKKPLNKTLGSPEKASKERKGKRRKTILKKQKRKNFFFSAKRGFFFARLSRSSLVCSAASAFKVFQLQATTDELQPPSPTTQSGLRRVVHSRAPLLKFHSPWRDIPRPGGNNIKLFTAVIYKCSG